MCRSEVIAVIALCLALARAHWPLLCFSVLLCAGCSQGVLPVTLRLRGGREREREAEVPQEEGRQTGPCRRGAAWSSSLISEHSSQTALTDQNRKHSPHHSYDSAPESKVFRPLNHHVCLCVSVCVLFKEESETVGLWMSLFAHDSASIKVACVFSACQKE